MQTKICENLLKRRWCGESIVFAAFGYAISSPSGEF